MLGISEENIGGSLTVRCVPLLGGLKHHYFKGVEIILKSWIIFPPVFCFFLRWTYPTLGLRSHDPPPPNGVDDDFPTSTSGGICDPSLEGSNSRGLYYLGGGFKDFLFSPLQIGMISNLTNICQMGWNHQLVTHCKDFPLKLLRPGVFMAMHFNRYYCGSLTQMGCKRLSDVWATKREIQGTKMALAS